jgi:integrase/recombinase XerD
MVALLSEDLPLIEVLPFILGEDGKRKVLLRTRSNQELFELYKTELALRVRNQRNLSLYRQLLDRFHDFLGKYPPSALLAKNFLTRFSSRKAATLYKYTSVIKGFMHWYGEDFNVTTKLPHQLPPYVEDDDIKKLIEPIENKQTHKESIPRDILLVEVAYGSGHSLE